MLNKKNVNFNKTILNQKFLTLVGLIIILLIAIPLVKNIRQRNKINNEIKSLEDDIKKLGNNNHELRGLIDYLESDQFVEEQARLNLGLKKQGEKVIVIEDSQNISGSVDTISDSMIKIPWLEKSISKDNITNTQKWLVYFFE